MQEVSRVRSTKRNLALQEPYGKERIHKKKLNPWYVSGFIDGEGSFSIGIGVHKTLKRGIEIRLLDRYPPQAKKRESYLLFKKAVFLFLKKEHLSSEGYKKVLALRKEIQINGKKHLMETARVRENRLPSGVSKHT